MEKPDKRNEAMDQEVEAVLLEALKKEPEISLPYGFAAIVARKAFARANLFGLYVKALGLAIGISILAGLGLFLYQPELISPLISIIINLKYVLVFILTVVCLIQYVDQKILHKYAGNINPNGFR